MNGEQMTDGNYVHIEIDAGSWTAGKIRKRQTAYLPRTWVYPALRAEVFQIEGNCFYRRAISSCGA